MADYTQVSAQISEETRRRLDLYARETGVKKSRFIEDAIVAHLDHSEETPVEYLIPAIVTVTPESWAAVVRAVDEPPVPTQALRDLMRRGDDVD